MSLLSKTANEPGPEKNPSAPKSAGSARKSASPAFPSFLSRLKTAHERLHPNNESSAWAARRVVGLTANPSAAPIGVDQC
jgi:hypothetical protein